VKTKLRIDVTTNSAKAVVKLSQICKPKTKMPRPAGVFSDKNQCYNKQCKSSCQMSAKADGALQ
jgi:hypothetical protein